MTKVPKTTMKVKRSCQRNSRKKIQTSATQSKKLKKARKPKMVVCYYMLNKKLNQSKKMNQNKRQNQNKGQAQPVPEQETLEKPTTSYNL
ncbi:Spermatid nuclear transition protein 4 [Camelus dromedarius]|uniref:Spermatid nuclear transition protein 4 n=1 Tax=Camelus dromedarius TaxID=9838 RepID=A0A5N4C1F8_CAMDR|nr:Spermatid nuclear transition protein 4 [Camelus dromedarius]